MEKNFAILVAIVILALSNVVVAQEDIDSGDGLGVGDPKTVMVTTDDSEDTVVTVTSISKRSARTGRNPETGKEIQINPDDDDTEQSEEVIISFHSKNDDPLDSVIRAAASDSTLECPEDDFPILCPDGTCVKENKECAGHMVLYSAGYSDDECPDGVCNKIVFDSLDELLCPDGTCVSTIKVNIQNTPPTAIHASPEFYKEGDFGIYIDENDNLAIDSSDARCETVDGRIVCKNEKGQTTISFSDTEQRCEDVDGDLYCWGSNERRQQDSEDLLVVVPGRGRAVEPMDLNDFSEYMPDDVDAKTKETKDMDQDGTPDIKLREDGDRLNLVGFGSFIVSKRSNQESPIHEESTTSETNPLYMPENVTVIDIQLSQEADDSHSPGAGAGKVSLSSFLDSCPKGDVCPVEVQVRDGSQGDMLSVITSRLSEKFIENENPVIYFDEQRNVVINVGSSSVCKAEEGQIHCSSGNHQAVFSINQENDARCEDEEGQLYCWGTSERASSVQFTFENTEDVCKDGSCVALDELSDFMDTDSDGDGLPDAVEAQGDFDTIDNAPEEKERSYDPDHLDLDDDDDGISAGDESSRRTRNNDVVLERAFTKDTENSMNGKSAAVTRARPSEWTEEDREDIGEYVRNLSNPEKEDFALAIAYQASDNERVREVRYNNETGEVEVDHEEEIRLFGFIPVRAQARTRIDSEMNERTEYPWWSFIAAKSNRTKFKAGAELSKSVN